MRVFRLATEQHLTAPLAEIFTFFSDAFNLERITPPWIRFQVLTAAPIEMRVGLEIDYRLRLHGLPLRWRSAITRWEPPHSFTDEQLHGPYRLWQHEHLFTADGDATLIRDRVRYAVPGGVLINRLVVERDVRRIFTHRGEVLREIFGGERMHVITTRETATTVRKEETGA